MKKLLFFLSILSIFVLAGCDLLRPPEVKHTLEASASAGGTISPSGIIKVLDGANQTFYFNPADGFETDSFVITDKYGLSQSYPLTNNTYTFLKISMDGYKVKVVFKETQESVTMRLLTQKPWKNILFQTTYVGTTNWINQSLFIESSGTGTYIFDKNYRFQHFSPNTQALDGDQFYSLKQDSLIIGSTFPDDGHSGFRSKIITLTDDTLVLNTLIPYYDENLKHDPTKDLDVLYTYSHPESKY